MYAKKFKTFCKKLPSATAQAHKDGSIAELIYSQLLWNASTRQATTAYKKLMSAFIDLNDLRMNMPHETIGVIGVSYPQAEERARRLRSILRGVYLREHDVKLTSLEGAGKTEAKEYIQTLEGMTHFVSGRVLSLCFGVSTFPVDDRTFRALLSEGVLHEEADLEEAASWLGRQVKAKDVAKVHGSLHAWVESNPVAKKKTTKKTTKKVVKKIPTRSVKKKIVKKKATKKKTAKNLVKKL